MAQGEKKLTGKQNKFATCISQGMTLTDAYKASYNYGKMKPSSIHVEACKLAASPKITQRIEVLKGRLERADIASSVSDRERVLEKLRTMMDSAEPSDSVKVRATELLGKTVGLFRDVREVIAQRSAAEIESDLIERLSQLTAQAVKDRSEHDKALN